MWPHNARIQHVPSNRRQEEVVYNDNLPGLQMQLSTFYFKTDIGKQPAIPGQVSPMPGQGTVFSLCLLPALSSLKQAQLWATSQQKLGNVPAFAKCVKHHLIFRATFPSWVWLGSSKIMSPKYF